MAPSSPHRPDDAELPFTGAFARSGISFAPVWELALDEAIADITHSQTTPPDLVVMFVSSAWSDSYPDVVDRVRRETGCRTLIGSCSSGIIADECCHESAAGVSLMAMWLPGARLTPLHINSVPETWPWGDQVSKDDVNGIILFSDPYRTDAQLTLIGLRESAPGIPMIGSLASTGRSDRRSWVFLNEEIYTEGAVAVTLEGPYDLLVRVSQGGTPIGEMWTMTEVEHNRIVSISNRPAVDVLRDTLAAPENHYLTIRDLMIGLPMDEYQDEFVREDFVARGILDTDPATGTIFVGGIPRQGQSVQFLKRDPQLASEDMDMRLQYFRELDRPIIGGILASCKGRGTGMFGRNDHDAAAVAAALPDVPVVGLYSLGELAPVRGVPAYNAFAAALGLIVAR